MTFPVAAQSGSPGASGRQCTMLRTAGRTVSRALHRSVAHHNAGSLPGPVSAAAVLSSQRWFNASAFHRSGHSGMPSVLGLDRYFLVELAENIVLCFSPWFERSEKSLISAMLRFIDGGGRSVQFVYGCWIRSRNWII